MDMTECAGSRDRLLAIVAARPTEFNGESGVAAGSDNVTLEAALLFEELFNPPPAESTYAEILDWIGQTVRQDEGQPKDFIVALNFLKDAYENSYRHVTDRIRTLFDALINPATIEQYQKTLESQTLLQRAIHSNDRVQLAGAVEALRANLSELAIGSGDWLICALNLNMAFRLHYMLEGDTRDLDEAIEVLRDALPYAPQNETGEAVVRTQLSVALRLRADRAGSGLDLDAAVNEARRAVDIAGSLAGRSDSEPTLVAALLLRFNRRNNSADVEEAIAVGRAALARLSNDVEGRSFVRECLGAALHGRFGVSGHMVDLDEAIQMNRGAVEGTRIGALQRAGRLSNLSYALLDRFARIGSRDDLDEAIAVGRDGVRELIGGHPQTALLLTNVAFALRNRYELTGDSADLDEAVSFSRDALAMSAPGQPEQGRQLAGVASVLLSRFERTAGQGDVDEAIARIRSALTITGRDYQDFPKFASLLGVALQARFVQFRDNQDLEEAVKTLRLAAEVLPAGHQDRSSYLSNLEGALHLRWEAGGDLTDLDEAIEIGRSAVAESPVDHPERARCLCNLANVLRVRFASRGAGEDIDEALRAFRGAAAMTTALPTTRLQAAVGLGRLAASGGQWIAAVEGHEQAIRLLRLVSPRALSRIDQEHRLSRLFGLGPDAAVCCVHAGLPDRAIELFEQGRGLLLGQELDLRTDLTTLAKRHPELAARFTMLRARLDGTGPSNEPTQPPPLLPNATPDDWGADAVVRRAGERRRQAEQEFDELTDEIRRTSGFSDFLLPVPAVGLLPPAGGVAAAIAVSRFGAYALILTADGALPPVELPGLTPEIVQSKVAEFLNAIEAAQHPHRFAAAEDRLSALLGWLWDTITEPVLGALGFDGAPDPADGKRSWPMIWWCPSGLLAFLPLHAAR
ncbi:CHAT domain-containing protein [Parafrankia soli]|uniref:CHAT domain-containing protein n=1 Tax=Parafrankia soli TaxID=2599596 RepID=UPI0034D76361